MSHVCYRPLRRFVAFSFAAIALLCHAQTPPTISAIADQITNEDVATAAISVTVNDAETPAASLTLSATSSNAAVVAAAGITFGGSGSARTVTIAPVANASGTTTVTVTVTDSSSSTASTSFLVTVNPINDSPSFTLAGNQIISFSGPTQVTVPNFATSINDGDPDFVQTLTFTVTPSNPALFTPSGQPAIDSAGTLTYTPSGVYGQSAIDVTLTDDATAGGPALSAPMQSRTITINNPAPALAYIPDPNATNAPRRPVYFFAGAPVPGQTRNASVNVTPSGGAATSTASNTTTVDSCAISGPDAASFGSVASTSLSFIGTTTTPQPLPLTCTSGIANRSATLTCTETRGTAAPVARTWPLSCPSCYLSITETLDTTAPNTAALSVISTTGQQTGRLNRFGVDSICGGTKTNPGLFTTVGSRQFDSYRITPPVAGCVTARLTLLSGSGTPLFFMVASPYVAATPNSNWVADPGLSGTAGSTPDMAVSFTAVAGQNYDIVVHEVNPGGGVGVQYRLEVDTCNVLPPTAQVSIDDVSLLEGNSGSTNAVFTVTRTNNTTAFSVPYSTTAGSATSGTDFTAVSGTLTFAAGGALTQTISVPIAGDTQFEADETFTVSLGAVTNTTGFTDITKAVGQGTIRNDDLPEVDLAITKTNGRSSSVPGAGVIYTITASNAGPQGATGATVADTFPAAVTGITWSCVGAGGGTCTASGVGNINDTVNLPPGASVTYTASGTVSAAATGSLSNTATVTAPSGVVDTQPANNSATDSDTLTPSADLAITVTDGVSSVVPGGSLTYTIVASNAGPSNVPSATVADTFPASLTGVAWTCVGAGGGSCPASGSGNINAAVTLPVGGSVTFTVTATVSTSASGTLSNTATISAAVADPTPGNNSATDTDSIQPRADLSITKTDGVTVANRGGTVTYTITASNAGPVAANGATVSDTLPAVLTGASWTCVGTGGGTCTASGSGNIADTVNLPVGASVTYTLTATLGNTASGTLSNTATIATPAGLTDPTPANNSATDTDTVNIPTLQVAGTVAAGSGTISCASPVNFGETTTCTLTPGAGSRVGFVSGCGGQLTSATTYVTGVITAACSVTASFELTAIPFAPNGVLALIAAMLALIGAIYLRRKVT